jgi:hypothetical protein
MIGYKGNQTINMITIKKPCAYKTKKNIGIDSTRDEVLKEYANEIDLSGTSLNFSGLSSKELIAGSIYGGMIFKFENDRVSSIFLGVAAE